MAKDSKKGGRKYLANLNNLSKPKPQTSASVVSDAPKYRGPTPAAVAAVAKFGSPSAVGFKPAYTPSAPEPDFTPEQLGTWGPFGFKPAEGSQAVMGNLLDRTQPLLAKQIGPILAERLVAAYNKGADKGVERFAYNEMFGNLDPEFFGRNSLSYINLFNPDYEFDTWQKKAQVPIDIAGSVYGGLPLQLGYAYADAKGLSEYAGPGMLGVQTAMTAWNVANNLKQSDFIGAAKAMMPLIKTLGAMGASHVVYKTTGLNVNGLVDAVQGGALGDIWGTIAGPPPPISGLRGKFVGTPTEPWIPLLPDLADAGGLLARQRAQETATELAAQRFYVQEAIRQGVPETEPALPAPEPVRTDALALARMADSDVKSRIEEQLVFPRMINQLPQGITHEEAMALVAMQPEMNRLQDDLLSTEIPVVLDQQLKTGVRGGDIFYQLTTLYAEDLKEIEQRRYIDPFESVDGDNRTAGTAENAWEAEAFARYRTFEDRTEGFVENRRGLTGGEAVLYGSLDKSYWEQNLGDEPREIAYFKLTENARILKITSDEELAQILTERNQGWMQPVEFFRSLKDDFDAIEIRVPANAQSHWWKQVGGDTLVILNDDAIRLVQNPRDILQAVLSRLDAPEPALPAPDAALQLEQQRQRTELRFARGIEEALERRRRLEDYETLERRRRYDEAATRDNPDRDLEGSGSEQWYLDVPGRYEDDLPIVRDQAALVAPATLAALDADINSHFRSIELFERRDQAAPNLESEAADAQRVRDQAALVAPATLDADINSLFRSIGWADRESIRQAVFQDMAGNPAESRYVYHMSTTIEPIIREGLLSGGVSGGSPIMEHGYGNIVHVFERAGIEWGGDVTFVEGYIPQKPVATFTLQELGIDEDQLGIGARAMEEGYSWEPSLAQMGEEYTPIQLARLEQQEQQNVTEIMSAYSARRDQAAPNIEEALERRRRLEDYETLERRRQYDDTFSVQNQVRQYALRVEYHRDYRGSGPNFFQFPDGLSFEQFRANPPELSHAQLDELEWDLASQRSTYEQHADFYDEPLPLDVPDTPERLRAAILDYETNAPNLGREATDAQRVRDQEWDEERAGEDEQYDHGALYPEPETAEQWRSVSNSRATADVERFNAKLLAEQEESQHRFFLGNVHEGGISNFGEAQGASWQDYWNAWSRDAGARIRLAARGSGVLPSAEQIAIVDAETRKYAMEIFLHPKEAARYDQEKQNWQEQFDAGNENPQRPYRPEDYGESSVGTLPYPAPQTPVFRSRLVELAEAQSIKKATGEEWLRRLNNKQKVNPGEVLISGIHSVLDPETVYTKEQVLAWLKYTQMTVTATTYQDLYKDIYLRPATYVQQTRLGVTQLPIPDPNRRISPNENYFEIQLNLSREGGLLDELPDHVDELAMAPNRPVPAHTIEDSFNWNDTVDMTPDVKTELTEKYGHKPEDLVSVDEYGTPHWMEGHGGFEGRNAIGRIGAEGLSVVYNGKRMKVMWVSEFQGATGDDNVANTPPFLRFNNHGFKITMKYLMQYAYKNGYDAIAWTNGKTQEELRDADGLLELYDNIIVGSVNDIIKKTKEKVGQVMRPDSPETGWHHIFEIRTPLMEHLINTEGFTISQAPEDKEKQQRAIA